MTKLIPLTRGFATIVDDADYEWLSQWKWCALVCKSGKVYACRKPGVLMHRFIMDTPKQFHTDHRDGNGLNNQRDNLRFATPKQNGRNRIMQRRVKSSQYKGVSWHKNAQQWYTRIKTNQKQIHIGGFDSELDAALAYNAAARIHHGEFARLNFPDEAQP